LYTLFIPEDTGSMGTHLTGAIRYKHKAEPEHVKSSLSYTVHVFAINQSMPLSTRHSAANNQVTLQKRRL